MGTRHFASFDNGEPGQKQIGVYADQQLLFRAYDVSSVPGANLHQRTLAGLSARSECDDAIHTIPVYKRLDLAASRTGAMAVAGLLVCSAHATGAGWASHEPRTDGDAES